MTGDVMGCPIRALMGIGDTVYRAAVDAYGRFGVYKGEITRIIFSADSVRYTVEYTNSEFKEYEVDPLYLFRKKLQAKEFVEHWRHSHNLSDKSAKEAREKSDAGGLKSDIQKIADAIVVAAQAARAADVEKTKENRNGGDLPGQA